LEKTNTTWGKINKLTLFPNTCWGKTNWLALFPSTCWGTTNTGCHWNTPYIEYPRYPKQARRVFPSSLLFGGVFATFLPRPWTENCSPLGRL
jgi:hypothetical protein